MAADAAEGISRPTESWTPARIFMAVSTVYHLALAMGGFAIDQTFPFGAEATERAGSEHIFGIFETNGWHSLAGLVVGAISLYYWLRPRGAREAAFALGVSQAVVLVGFAIWSPSTFWFASNGADQIIHSITAIGGIGSAFLTTRGRTPRVDTSRARHG